MPNYKRLITEAQEEVSKMIELRELLRILEENFENPQRVKLVTMLYHSHLECHLDNLHWTLNRMKKINSKGSKKSNKDGKEQNTYSITFKTNHDV